MRKNKYREDALFARTKKKHAAPLIILFVLLLLLCGFSIYQLLLNAHVSLVRQSVTVTSLPGGLEGFKILHISDLHGISFGPSQDNLMSVLEGQKYQAVCLTGDLTDSKGSPKGVIRLIEQLPEGVPVYFISGDDDPDPILATPHASQSAKADYILAIEKTGAVYLDAPQRIDYGGATVWFCPEALYALDLDASEQAVQKRIDELMQEPEDDERDAQLTAAQYQLDRFARVRNAQKDMTVEDIQIALTHFPLTSDGLRELHDEFSDGQSVYISGVSLVLAGHYNAGQWRLPGLGAVYAPASFPLSGTGFFPSDTGLVGLTTVLGVSQYISPGLGASSAYPGLMSSFRLFNQPCVTILTLTRKLAN